MIQMHLVKILIDIHIFFISYQKAKILFMENYQYLKEQGKYLNYNKFLKSQHRNVQRLFLYFKNLRLLYLKTLYEVLQYYFPFPLILNILYSYT